MARKNNPGQINIDPQTGDVDSYDPLLRQKLQYVSQHVNSDIPEYIRNYWKSSDSKYKHLKDEYNRRVRKIWEQADRHVRKQFFAKAGDDPATLGTPTLGYHFRSLSIDQLKANPGRYTQPISVLDIETGHQYEPLSVSALKGRIDRQTGEFVITDSLERYYLPTNESSASFWESFDTHHLTGKRLQSYRDQQNAQYSKVYDTLEQENLLEFLKGSTVVGHNIQDFDIKKLGIESAMQQYKTLDTMVFGENIGLPRRKQGLTKMFKMFTGMTEKEAGLQHHMSFSDVIETALLLSALYRTSGTEGRDLRYVLNHPSVSYVAHSNMAGTSISKAGYLAAQNKNIGEQYYMYEDALEDELTEFYDKEHHPIAPEGMHLTDAGSYDDLDDGWGPSSVASLEHMKDVVGSFTTTVQQMKETLVAYNVTRHLQLASQASRMDEGVARAFLKKSGIPESESEESAFMKILGNSRLIAAARNRAQTESVSLRADEARDLGLITQEQHAQLEAYANSGDYTPKELAMVLRRFKGDTKAGRAVYTAHRDADVASLNNEYTWDDGYSFDRRTQQRKLDYIKQARKAGYITGRDADRLQMSREALTGSYEDLVEATDELIKKNQELLKVYEAMGKIKPYDINQYVRSAESHWNGILSDAKGLVPRFMLNPIQRLTNATFNATEQQLAPLNAVQRVWNSGIGTAVTGGLTAGLGPVGFGIGSAITGTINAGTQIIGNIKQAKMETSLLGIQNSLNTVGAAVSWILTPFQLLGKALKVATSGLSGLNISAVKLMSRLNSFMGTNLNSLGQMGNPLTTLTGVDYVNYQRTGLMDVSSLLSRGSTNTDIENFAIMQRNLYRFGQMDTGKALAANMLGVFSEAFVPTTDTKSAYYNMANKILNNMQGQSEEQRADTMYYASQLSGTLAQILQTAIKMGVKDIRDLEKPSNGMYWRPIDEREEPVFRRVYKEYNTATQQWSFTKQRVASRLWDTFGRDIYDSFNRIMDAAATGQWGTVKETAKGAWDKVKTGAQNIWAEFSDEDFKTWIKGKFDAFKDGGLDTIKEWAKVAGTTIVNTWTTLIAEGLHKIQGFIAELSTIKLDIDWKKLLSGDPNGIQIRSIRDIELDSSKDSSEDILIHGQGYVKTQLGYDYKYLEPLLEWTYGKNWADTVGKGPKGELDVRPLTVNDLKLDMLRKAKAYDARTGTKSDTISIEGLENVPVTNENIDKLMLYLLRSSSTKYGLFSQGGARHSVGLDAYTSEDDVLGKMIDKFIEAMQKSNDTLLTAAGISTSGGAAVPIDAGKDQKLLIELKVGDKTVGATYTPGKGISFMGMQPLNTVQIGNGMSLSINMQQGGF